jgi:hypothetical protein
LKVSWFLENTNVEQERVNKDLSFLTHSFRFTASVILVTDISINLEEACTCANPAKGGSGELGKNVISASLPVITCSCTSGVSQANGNIAAPPHHDRPPRSSQLPACSTVRSMVLGTKKPAGLSLTPTGGPAR